MLVRTFLTYLGFGAISQILALVINVILKGKFTPEDYVQIIASLTLLDIFVRVAVFGQDSIIVRYKEYFHTKYLAPAILFQLIVSLCMFVLVNTLSSITVSVNLVIGSIYILFLSLFNIGISSLISKQKSLEYGVFSTAKFILILIFLVTVPIVFGIEAPDYLKLIIFAHLIVLIPLYFRRNNLSSKISNGHRSFLSYYKYGLLFGVLGVLGVLANFVHRGLIAHVSDIEYYADFVFMATIYYQISTVAPAVAKSLFPIYFQSSEAEQSGFDLKIYKFSLIIVSATLLLCLVTHVGEFIFGEFQYKHLFLVLVGSIAFTLQYSINSAAIYKEPNGKLMILSNSMNIAVALGFLFLLTPLSVDIIATGFLIMWFGNFIFQLYVHDWKFQNPNNLKLISLNLFLLGVLNV